MYMIKDIDWFKEYLAPNFINYEINFKSFKNGDFGDIERVEFEGKGQGGSIDFWSSGWLGIHLYHYKEDRVIMNILLEPEQNLEKEKAFEDLLKRL